MQRMGQSAGRGAISGCHFGLKWGPDTQISASNPPSPRGEGSVLSRPGLCRPHRHRSAPTRHYPKAVAKSPATSTRSLTFYDFPVEHWKHLRTSNPISTFATVRLRQRVTKGPGCRDAGLAMAFKLLEGRPGAVAAQSTATSLVALVRAGPRDMAVQKPGLWAGLPTETSPPGQSYG